jgi:hypothetical protein
VIDTSFERLSPISLCAAASACAASALLFGLLFLTMTIHGSNVRHWPRASGFYGVPPSDFCEAPVV